MLFEQKLHHCQIIDYSILTIEKKRKILFENRFGNLKTSFGKVIIIHQFEFQQDLFYEQNNYYVEHELKEEYMITIC